MPDLQTQLTYLSQLIGNVCSALDAELPHLPFIGIVLAPIANLICAVIDAAVSGLLTP